MRKLTAPFAFLILLLVPMASAHDTFTNLANQGSSVTVVGHDHTDTVIFTPYDDLGFGNGGADGFYGNGGPDEFHMGQGSDYADGQGGNDDINGNDGPDSLYGSSGNDVIKGGDGVDHIDCGSGSGDAAYGGLGDDTFAECDGNAIE